MRIATSIILSFFLVACCNKEVLEIEPSFDFFTPCHVIEDLPSAFPPLSVDEMNEDWGKELLIGNTFAKENDLYRAITSFKRASILISKDKSYRREQIEYDIILAYYLGGKYHEAVEAFESSSLITVSTRFLALDNLLNAVYDSYLKIGNEAKAKKVKEFLNNNKPEIANEFTLFEEVIEADLPALQRRKKNNPDVNLFLEAYNENKMSVKTAKNLNALLPGAGYYYIGQKNTAITAFLVNALFMAASYYCFEKGNWPAGTILASLEMGWYFGGINGAGLGAKEMNDHLYESLGKEFLIKQKLFPVLKFETSF